MEPTDALDPKDLRDLFRSPAAELLGLIMALNHGPKYRNALDAIAIANRIAELRSDDRGKRSAIPFHRPDRPFHRSSPGRPSAKS